ncbi:MAG TPA: hypothetical protein VG753_01755 [Candidatus Paceibacterota bacterium]|nr:hypothetical protein [Candidatus Paceibacterota bacterium]
MEADVLEAIMPDRWRTPKQITDAVNAAWSKRGEKTFFLRRPRTLGRGDLDFILEVLEYQCKIKADDESQSPEFYKKPGWRDNVKYCRIEAGMFDTAPDDGGPLQAA